MRRGNLGAVITREGAMLDRGRYAERVKEEVRWEVSNRAGRQARAAGLHKAHEKQGRKQGRQDRSGTREQRAERADPERSRKKKER